MCCSDPENCGLLLEYLRILKDADEIENLRLAECTNTSSLRPIIKYLSSWSSRHCSCIFRRFAHIEDNIHVLTVCVIKCFIVECQKFSASLKAADCNVHMPDILEELFLAVETIFHQKFPLFHSSEKPLHIRRFLAIFFADSGLDIIGQCFLNATPATLPLHLANILSHLVSNLRNCYRIQTFTDSSNELTTYATNFAKFREGVLKYLSHVSDQDVREPRARVLIEFIWGEVRLASTGSLDEASLCLALTYLTSSTMTMRLVGLGQIVHQIGLCQTSKCEPRVIMKMKSWLFNNKFIDLLFGANSHLEVIRHCHDVVMFLALWDALSADDLALIWSAAQDKHKCRDIVCLLDLSIKYFSNELLDLLKKHVHDFPLSCHTEQTFVLAANINKECWKRFLSIPAAAHPEVICQIDDDNIATPNITAHAEDSPQSDSINVEHVSNVDQMGMEIIGEKLDDDTVCDEMMCKNACKKNFIEDYQMEESLGNTDEDDDEEVSIYGRSSFGVQTDTDDLMRKIRDTKTLSLPQSSSSSSKHSSKNLCDFTEDDVIHFSNVLPNTSLFQTKIEGPDSVASGESLVLHTIETSALLSPGNYLLWDIVIGDKFKELSTEMQECLESVLYDIIERFISVDVVAKSLMDTLLDNVAGNRSVHISFFLIQKIISKANWITKWAEEEKQLTQVFFKNFESEITSTTSVHCLNTRFTFLSSIFDDNYSPATFTLSDTQLNILWDRLVSNDEHRQFLMTWMNFQLTNRTSHCFRRDQWRVIYSEKVCQLPVDSIRQAELKFLSALFDLVISKDPLLCDDDSPYSKQVKIGLDQFWKIAFTNNRVYTQAAEIINQYYLNTPNLVNEMEFIENVFHKIDNLSLQLTNEDNMDTSLISLERVMSLLVLHVERCWSTFAYHLRLWGLNGKPIVSHYKSVAAPAKSSFIKIHCQCESARTIFTLPATDTLSELRAEIATWFSPKKQQHDQVPDDSDIHPYRYRLFCNGKELGGDCNAKSLKDCGIRDESTVHFNCQRLDLTSLPYSSSQVSPWRRPTYKNFPLIILLEETYFDKLLKLLQHLSDVYFTNTKSLDVEIYQRIECLSRQVWELLMLLPTYPPIKDKFEILTRESLSVGEGDNLDWKSMLDTGNIFRMLYSLQMLESIANISNKPPSTSAACSSRSHSSLSEQPLLAASVAREWKRKFVETRGLEYLIDALTSSDLLCSEGAQFGWSEWKQECVSSILRLLVIFSTDDALTSTDDDQDDVFPENTTASDSQTPHCTNRFLSQFVSIIREKDVMSLLAAILVEATHDFDNNPAQRNISLRTQIITHVFRLLEVWFSYDLTAYLLLATNENFSHLITQMLILTPYESILRACSDGLYSLATQSFEFTKLLLKELVKFIEGPVCSLSDGEPNSGGTSFFRLFERLMGVLEKSPAKVERDFVDMLVNRITGSLRYAIDSLPQTGDENVALTGLLTICCMAIKINFPYRLKQAGRDFLNLLFNCIFVAAPKSDSFHSSSGSVSFTRPSTRKAAYNLILEGVMGCYANYVVIYKQLLKQNKRDIRTSVGWNYWPQDDRRSDTGYVGLVNLGATCYMAAAVQHLFMLHEARAVIFSASQIRDHRQASVLHELQKMFAYLQDSELKAYNPKSFCRSYIMDNQPLNTGDQKDMTEFFNDLIGKLEETTSDLKELVHDVFRGEITNSVISQDCNHVSKNVEAFYTIRCQVADLKDLYESLDDFCQVDLLEGDNMYTCSLCQKKVKAEKRASFKKLPRILCINTMRYKFNMETMMREKVNTHFSFPRQLDMSRYTEAYLIGNNKVSSSSISASEPCESTLYDLIGVTVHTGAADSGHYYCFIRDRSCPHKDQWFMFNDAEVKVFDPERIPYECYGGQQISKTYNHATDKYTDYAYEKSHSAYMLFYERTVDLVRVPEKLPSIQRQMAPPDRIRDKIIRDNRLLQHNKTIFDNLYFEFMYTFCKSIPRALPDDKAADLDFSSCKLSTTFVLETLIHSKDTSSLHVWVEYINNLFDKSQRACEWFIRTLSASNWWLSQILIKCSISNIRQIFVQLIRHVLKRLRDFMSTSWQDWTNSGLKDLCRRLLSFASLRQMRYHLLNLSEYFMLFNSIALMGRNESLLLISEGSIAILVSFFLSVKTQSVVDHNSQNSALCLGSSSSSSSSSSDEDDCREYSTIVSDFISFTEDKFLKPAAFDSLVGFLQTLLEQASKSHPRAVLSQCLSKEDLNVLFMKNFDFMKIAIEEEINLSSICSILNLLININPDIDQMLADYFGTIIIKTSPDLVKPYFKVLANLEEMSVGREQTQPFSEYILNQAESLLERCPRGMLFYLTQCTNTSKLIHTWALDNLWIWVRQLLIEHQNYQVRFDAAFLLISLVPNHEFRSAFHHKVKAFHIPLEIPNMSAQHLIILHHIYVHLLKLLKSAEAFADQTAYGSYRLSPYFIALTNCVISKAEKLMFTEYMPDLWKIFHPHFSEPKLEQSQNKQALLMFWYAVCSDCPENVQKMLEMPIISKQIAYNYILVNHEERDLVNYNNVCLPYFFGILRLCCKHSPSFSSQLSQHENLVWALSHISPYHSKYQQAAQELFEIVKTIFNQRSAMTPEEKNGVEKFKANMIQKYAKTLERIHWTPMLIAFKLLLETPSDKQLLIESKGLNLVTEALVTVYEMHITASACNVITDLHEIIKLLADLLKTYRKSSEVTNLEVSKLWPSHVKTSELLISLLNSYVSNDLRTSVILCLKEILCVFPTKFIRVVIPFLLNLHLSCDLTSYSFQGNLGPFFPRRTSMITNLRSDKTHQRSLQSNFQMFLHPSVLESQRGVDVEYDENLYNYYSLYHNFVEFTCRFAFNRGCVTDDLLQFMCRVATEAIPLSLEWFARLLTETDIYTSEHIPKLCAMPCFVGYFDRVICKDRLLLNNSKIYSFFTSYIPKVLKIDHVTECIDEVVASVMAEKTAFSSASKEEINKIAERLNGDLRALNLIMAAFSDKEIKVDFNLLRKELTELHFLIKKQITDDVKSEGRTLVMFSKESSQVTPVKKRRLSEESSSDVSIQEPSTSRETPRRKGCSTFVFKQVDILQTILRSLSRTLELCGSPQISSG